MAGWTKDEIVIAGGTKVAAQMPVIISASRSTDIPAFYADWFMERLKAGYVKWYNPFNGVPLYVSFAKTRLIVFWSKNPAPLLNAQPNGDAAPIDVLESERRNYYIQFTLNDYDDERIEPNVPSVEKRISTLVELNKRISHHARDRVVWRFDPLILTDKISPKTLLEKIKRIGDRIAPYTSRLVFSFIDINAYAKVGKNLHNGGIAAREFSSEEMLEMAEGISRLAKEWGIAAATCGEAADLPGIEHNRCIDDRLILRCFSHDKELMEFIGAKFAPGSPLFGEGDRWVLEAYKKDKGQRLACGCISSKDIGEYNTCPHLCHYCYANTNNAAATANWKRHCECPHAETITGK